MFHTAPSCVIISQTDHLLVSQVMQYLTKQKFQNAAISRLCAKPNYT